MKRIPPCALRLTAVGGLLLATTCGAFAQVKKAPSSPRQVTLGVAHNCTSSFVKLNLSGIKPAYDSKGGVTPPPPDWAVRSTAGKEVASGKFQYG